MQRISDGLAHIMRPHMGYQRPVPKPHQRVHQGFGMHDRFGLANYNIRIFLTSINFSILLNMDASAIVMRCPMSQLG